MFGKKQEEIIKNEKKILTSYGQNSMVPILQKQE